MEHFINVLPVSYCPALKISLKEPLGKYLLRNDYDIWLFFSL